MHQKILQRFLLFLLFQYFVDYGFGKLSWNYTLTAASRRSQDCELSSENCVCLGTENGRTTISVENNLNHYERLKRSFHRCRRIVGNLEITHIDDNDFKDDFEELPSDTINGPPIRIRKKPFEFLQDLEEITGYLLIFNVPLHQIEIPKLTIIWGEKTHEDNALQIDNSALNILSLPSLRSKHAAYLFNF